MRRRAGRALGAAVSVVVLCGALTGCSGGTKHVGSDADQVACSQLGSTLKLATGHTPSAILMANYRTTQNAAENADDARLRASIVSIAGFFVERAAKGQVPDSTYAVSRCERIGAPLPTKVCIPSAGVIGSHGFYIKSCG